MPLRSFETLENLSVKSRLLDISVDESEEELYYDFYESPCLFHASNDEISPAKIDSFDVCDMSFFGGCNQDVEELESDFEDGAVRQLDIYFDYEMYYRDGANVTKTIQNLEAVMLDHVAAVVGLTECDSDRRRMNRGLLSEGGYTHDFTAEEIDIMLGLSSDPMDYPDPDHTECFIPVASSRVSKASCAPISGIMQVFVKNSPLLTIDEENSIRSGLMRLIRWGMQEDLYVSGNIRNAAFIGTRIDEAETFDSIRDSQSEANQIQVGADNRDRTASVVGGMAAVVVLVAVILFVVAKPSRRRNEATTPVLSSSASSPVDPSSEGSADSSDSSDTPQQSQRVHRNQDLLETITASPEPPVWT